MSLKMVVRHDDTNREIREFVFTDPNDSMRSTWAKDFFGPVLQQVKIVKDWKDGLPLSIPVQIGPDGWPVEANHRAAWQRNGKWSGV